MMPPGCSALAVMPSAAHFLGCGDGEEDGRGLGLAVQLTAPTLWVLDVGWERATGSEVDVLGADALRLTRTHQVNLAMPAVAAPR
jgi:hypothetical protein